MYSYNGTVLPALPEWNKTVYPYAVIQMRDSSAIGGDGSWMACLLGSNKPLSYDNANNNFCLETPWHTVNIYATNSESVKDIFSQSGVSVGLNEWGEASQFVDTGEVFTIDGLVWSNYNISDTDGSIYLSASEPVPVYE